MKNLIQYDKKGGDDQYTPIYGVECILPHIQHLKSKKFWLPFDTEKSAFYRVLTKNGFNVIATSIETGTDFLTAEPPDFDVILSNPPYKNKRLYIERALSFNKPFAFLLPINILSDSVINNVFSDNEVQFLIPDRRMIFYHSEKGLRGRPSFKASYIGKNFFQEQIIFVNINLKDENGFEVFERNRI